MNNPQQLVREIIRAAGGSVERTGGFPSLLSAPTDPFATGDPVEGDTIESVEVQPAGPVFDSVGFLDGIQNYSVVGRIGVTPVVFGHVSAAVLRRVEKQLKPAVHLSKEVLLVPDDRIPTAVIAELGEILPVVTFEPGERAHPLLETFLAGREVEAMREDLELQAAREFRKEDEKSWLVIDGGIRGYPADLRSPNTIGVIKSHETQFLAGRDLEKALMLEQAHRTTVFSRFGGEAGDIYTWYLRLWDWDDEDILFGLIRLERTAHARVVLEADEVSAWMLSERSPIAGRDRRWDRLLYPIGEVEQYLRAVAGERW